MAKICDDYFVASLEIITKKLKISDDVAGATFMAVGSSAPELFTAIIALTKVGVESVGAGTIVGSAIFNILIIIGASALVSKIVLDRKPVLRDILFYLASLIVLLSTFLDGVITVNEALIYLTLYVIYLIVLHYWGTWFPHKHSPEKIQKEPDEEAPASILGKIDIYTRKAIFFPFPNLKKNSHLYGLTFFFSVVYIAVLSWIMVDLAVFIAHGIGVPEAIIALTVLAAGTSVPDLMSSIIASRKGHGNMAVSNAIGSNTFDILIGLGLPWFVYILWKGQDVHVGTENLLSSMILLFSTVLLLGAILIGKKFEISKKEAWFLIAIYLGYLGFAITLALRPDLLG